MINNDVLRSIRFMLDFSDGKVVEIVQAEHKKAYELLADNKRKLDEIAQYLYEKETISGEEFMRILNAQPQLPAGPSADSTNQAQ